MFTWFRTALKYQLSAAVWHLGIQIQCSMNLQKFKSKYKRKGSRRFTVPFFPPSEDAQLLHVPFERGDGIPDFFPLSPQHVVVIFKFIAAWFVPSAPMQVKNDRLFDKLNRLKEELR